MDISTRSRSTLRSMSAAASASLLGKYWHCEPTLAPATRAHSLVVTDSNPAVARTRAVVSDSASTSSVERCWRGFFRGEFVELRLMSERELRGECVLP